MKSTKNAHLSSTNGLGEVVVKLESNLDESSLQQKECYVANVAPSQKFKSHFQRQESEENQSSSALCSGNSGLSMVEQESSANDSGGPCSASPISSAPVCRQFWKAGNYDEGLASKINFQNATGYLHIHPRFLHSNATSHKWAFGAIAELLDNAVDEIHRGATSVIVDKTSNPRNGNSALLIQDNGGGMDPEALRRCLSFGFSDKKIKNAIGQYGNGFKTSSMRLGADVLVFSKCMNRKLTQSVGLLSYTFLMQTGHDRIVVPMVNYEFDAHTSGWNKLHSEQNFENNLSLLLRWSPYSTEAELLNQFKDVGDHGTKIVIYNLWCNDEGKMELDFDSDPEDICILGGASNFESGGSRRTVSGMHIANCLQYSLRAYLSILYLRVPENFSMLLRGRVVEYHNIASDLKYPQFIVYKPQSGGIVEGEVITTIGFLKEAPLVNIHGFNVYHKNRLILPFWHVVSYSDSRGRGVVGVLEANFIEPTHNKQEFEKTPVFQKLEQRLKHMTWEYWDYHCQLIGYHQVWKKSRPSPAPTSSQLHGSYQPVVLGGNPVTPSNAKTPSAPGAVRHQVTAAFNVSAASSGNLSTSQRNLQQGATAKRRDRDCALEPENVKRKAVMGAYEAGSGLQFKPVTTAPPLENQEAANLLQENKKLRMQCFESEKRQEELNHKVTTLRKELKQAQREYARLLIEIKLLDRGKEDNSSVAV